MSDRKRRSDGREERLDALFLHVPRFSGPRREVMVMPLGVPALANLLADAGRSVAIWHLGIEAEAVPGFSLRRALEAARPRLVLLPLHFNPQARNVIDVAHRIRAWLPEATIVLGGLTASVFAREAVESLGCVDAVVRGDGEEPLLALARAILDGDGALDGVPNLTWRGRDGRVRENAHAWVLDAATAGRLRHGDLALLRHREAYVARSLYADFSEGAEGSEGYPFAAYLNAGRGCTAHCVSCGGSAESQRLTSARRGILLYPVAKLARDVADAAAAGARTLRTCFDPPAARPHIRRWLEAIRADGHALRLIYDFWQLAPRAFLDDLARAFPGGGVAVYSPDCGSEQVRRRVRGFSFGNAALLRAIRESQDAGFRVHCFFAAGLPTETPADVSETERLIEAIRRQTGAGVSVTPMFVDPGSPLALHAARLGARLLRRTLRDYYDQVGIADGPGYETEHFGEREILAACKRLLRVAVDGRA